MSRRVLVTGLGCLSAAGATPEGFWRALREGMDLARQDEIALGGGRSVAMHLARLGPVDWDAYLPAARRRRMSLLSQAWVVACMMARSDAKLPSTADPERSAMILGTGFGGVQDTVDYLEGIRRDGLGLGSPFLFSESVANAPSGHAAIDLDCRGLNLTLTCGDLSGALAVEVGARAIRDDRADRVYAGGVEQMAGPMLAVLARLGNLPAPRGEGERRWRSPSRRGPSRPPGEGAACLLLEAADEAEKRGARPYAEVRGGYLGSDPTAARTRWSASAERRAEALSRALRAAGVSSCDIDAAFLHACGDAGADAAEDEAVSRLLASEQPAAQLAVLRPSHVFGTFAAAGAFSPAAAALWLHEGPPATRRAALVSAAAWGGGCLGLVLGHAA